MSMMPKVIFLKKLVRCQTKVHNLSSNYVWGFDLELLIKRYICTMTTWNRILDNIRQIVIELSLEHPELTPRELSVLLLEESQIFVSESSFYRILHERGLL